ncbi:hypothetical protein V6N11_058656 [Hibiscus sabdariffa]|uniref:Uncharacterized protein n=1 Tax=Hibiscus sabdariffa TaxID=183260 RepID=A0ABR2U5N1_9ROSI
MSRQLTASLPTMPRQPDASLHIVHGDSIATPVPLADPSQQDVSHDLPQRHVSPDLPQQDVSATTSSSSESKVL